MKEKNNDSMYGHFKVLKDQTADVDARYKALDNMMKDNLGHEFVTNELYNAPNGSDVPMVFADWLHIRAEESCGKGDAHYHQLDRELFKDSFISAINTLETDRWYWGDNWENTCGILYVFDEIAKRPDGNELLQRIKPDKEESWEQLLKDVKVNGPADTKKINRKYRWLDSVSTLLGAGVGYLANLVVLAGLEDTIPDMTATEAFLVYTSYGLMIGAAVGYGLSRREKIKTRDKINRKHERMKDRINYNIDKLLEKNTLDEKTSLDGIAVIQTA